MNDQESGEFCGFDENLVQSSVHLCWKYVNTIDRLERNFSNFVSVDSKHSAGMDLSLTKCFEDTINSCNTSLRGIAGDNDSGYISQNVESNSSVETAGDNRQLAMATSNVKDVYLNEDTLFEKPQIFAEQAQHGESDEEYEEFGHLFFMSGVPGTPILNSSVASQKTNYSGFEGDETGISDVSAVIPFATPIKVHLEQLNGESKSVEKIQHNAESVSNVESAGESKENVYVNAENNLKAISPTEENVCSKMNFSLNSSETENTMNCIQTRMMDANNCNMSLFESFYTFVCDLYTRDDVTEDLANVSINPKSLQINNSQLLESSASKSPYKNSYMELETKSKLTENNSVSTITSTDAKSITGNDDEIIVLDSPVIGRTSSTITSNLDVNKATLEDNKLKDDKKALENVRSTPLVKQNKVVADTPMSPELFSDEEPEPSEVLSHSMTQLQKTCDQMYITKNDRKLLKRANESLGGVPPPPSVTIMQMPVADMLQKITENKHLFATNILNVNNGVDNCSNCVHKESVNTDKTRDMRSKNMDRSQDCSSKIVEKRESLLVTCKNGDFDSQRWPDIMQYRYHGLHYNRSKISEEFEHLCVKYAERYVGAETQSSCTVFGTDILSPSKRRSRFKRVVKSPGKRLSHLARRRITFSKDSLQAGSTAPNYSFIGARSRQIMVDARKCELTRRKSPRKKSPRKTPGKSPRRKAATPSSSSKKQLSMWLKRSNTGESLDSVSSASSRASVTKRALFQSPPDREESSNSALPFLNTNTSDSDLSESSRRRTPRRALFTSPFKASPSKMTISALYPAKRKVTPKRSLFKSPGKASPAKLSEACDKKRKRTESDDVHPSKIARSMSLDVKDLSSESKSRALLRSHSLAGSSSGLQSQDMAEHRKKKLMWAVAEALRSQNIDLKHPQFKVFASVLARVIRHFLPNLFTNGPRPEGSTTESMLRIARQYVFAVTRGKTVDQIIREAHRNSRLKANKPSGYVALDKVNQPDGLQIRNKENVLQDRVNIIGSGRTATEVGESNKNRRGENVERIRRVINFGDDDDHSGVR